MLTYEKKYVFVQFPILDFKVNEADGQWSRFFRANLLHSEVFGYNLATNLFCQHLLLPEFYHCRVCVIVPNMSENGIAVGKTVDGHQISHSALWMKSIINANN